MIPEVALTGINPAALANVRRREEAEFSRRTPKSDAMRQRAMRHMPGGVPMSWMRGLYRFLPPFVERGSGAYFGDIDGNRYIDFNLCDLSMTLGYGPPAIAEAVRHAVARGAHYLLPTEDAVIVAEALAQRVGLPFWQFTLSASSANVEVIRIARLFTRRTKIIVFEGHYHGHIDETLVARDGDGQSLGDLLGLNPMAGNDTVILPFNDLRALQARLALGDVALILTEPVMTNCTLVHPEPGFLESMGALAKHYGALLCLDEAHSFQFAYGGIKGATGVECDFVVLGKGLGTGISFGLYGMSAPLAEFFERHSDVDIGPKGIATGGTTYATSVALAAARVALTQMMTPDGHARINGLGARLSSGLQTIFDRLALPWTAQSLGPRAGYCLFRELPKNGEQAWRSMNPDFIDTRRIFLANRGIWDAVFTAGPQASFAHQAADIDAYLDAAEAFLVEIRG